MEEAENPEKSKQKTKNKKKMKKIFKISEVHELISSTDENLNKRSGSKLNDFSSIFVCAENESDAILQGIANFLTDINLLRIVERTENSVTVTKKCKTRVAFFGEKVTSEVTVKVTFMVEGEI